MPASFYKYIYQEENFFYLNGKSAMQPKVSEIISSFLSQSPKKLCDFEE